MKKDSREILEALVERDTYRSMYSKLNNPDRLAIAEMLKENEQLREALEAALAGHEWYKETFPKEFNECDFEWREMAKQALGDDLTDQHDVSE